MDAVYERKATDRSKALIGLFLLTAAYVFVATDWRFGWWWVAVVPAGMVLISLLGGSLFALGHYADRHRVPFLSTLLDIGQLILAVLGSYYALKQVHDWIA